MAIPFVTVVLHSGEVALHFGEVLVLYGDFALECISLDFAEAVSVNFGEAVLLDFGKEAIACGKAAYSFGLVAFPFVEVVKGFGLVVLDFGKAAFHGAVGVVRIGVHDGGVCDGRNDDSDSGDDGFHDAFLR